MTIGEQHDEQEYINVLEGGKSLVTSEKTIENLGGEAAGWILKGEQTKEDKAVGKQTGQVMNPANARKPIVGGRKPKTVTNAEVEKAEQTGGDTTTDVVDLGKPTVSTGPATDGLALNDSNDFSKQDEAKAKSDVDDKDAQASKADTDKQAETEATKKAKIVQE